MKNEEIILNRLNALEKEVKELKGCNNSIVQATDNRPVTERLTSYKKCFDDVKSRYDTLPEWLKQLVNGVDAEDVPMWLRVFVIVNALNEGKLIKRGEKRHTCWLKEDEEGSGWCFCGSNYYYVDSFSSARLEFLDEKMPKFYADTFKEEIKSHYNAE